MPGTEPKHGRVRLAAFLAVSLGLALAPSWAQKAPSAKDLVRDAEIDQKNNRWEAAREKYRAAAAQKPKDKKIADALLAVETYLADQAAEAAQTACDQLEIDKCEKQATLAASYGNTQRVKDAQSKLAARKQEVQDQWKRAQQMMSAGQLAEATVELENLTRFSYLLPNLPAEKERLRRLRVDAFLEQAGKDVAAQRWDAAMEAYSAALRLDPGNSEATRGSESARLEKAASTAFLQAQNAFQSKGYQVAYDANQKALQLFPNRQPYQELKKQIAAEWSKVLLEDARRLSSNPENLKDNQKALEALETVRRLDPRAPGLNDQLKTVRDILYSIYLQKAGEYLTVADNSRVGMAYAYWVSAQQTNPGGEFPFSAKLREAYSIFQRKRAVQVLVNVENLSPTPANFSDALSRRVRAAMEKLGLPDLRLRTPQEYEKDRMEDPQFVENKPDGKSPTAQFTVSLTDYDSGKTGEDKPIDKPSKFISGQEMVPNPLYEKLEAEYRKVNAALLAEKPKPGKRTREGYTSEDLRIKQQQMLTTPREVARDKISDYTYQEYHLAVRALIKMNLELRDMLEKQLLGSEAIEASEENKQVEIAGVREKDVNNLMNKSARLPPVEQALQECNRKALQQVDDKVPRVVTQYLNRFYAEGMKALREGRSEEAVENFLCHWFFFRGRVNETQSQQIRDHVRFHTGLDLTAIALAPSGL